MSLHELSLVWKSSHIQWKDGQHRIDIWENAILGRLAEMVNDQHEGCWPSYGYLARETKMSRRKAIRVVKDLTKFGVVNVKQRTENGRRTSNIYSLNLDRLILWKSGVGWCPRDTRVVSTGHHGVVSTGHPNRKYRTVIEPRCLASLDSYPTSSSTAEEKAALIRCLKDHCQNIRGRDALELLRLCREVNPSVRVEQICSVIDSKTPHSNGHDPQGAAWFHKVIPPYVQAKLLEQEQLAHSAEEKERRDAKR